MTLALGTLIRLRSADDINANRGRVVGVIDDHPSGEIGYLVEPLEPYWPEPIPYGETEIEAVDPGVEPVSRPGTGETA
jgi:hypothetical protein